MSDPRAEISVSPVSSGDESVTLSSEPAASVPLHKQLIKQAIGLVLMGVFLWLAFKDINMAQLWGRMQSLNFGWVAAVCASALFSHWLRAVRWVIMLQPLADKDPTRTDDTKKVSSWNAFCAVIIGYAVNIAIPRGGEVARVVSICKTERLPWVAVLPTMLIDRLLDFAMLVLLMGLTLVLMPAELKAQLNTMVPIGPLGAVLCTCTLIGLLLLPKLGVIARAVLKLPVVLSLIPDKVRSTIGSLADQFEEGTACLSKPTAFPAIAGLTFAMWGFYFANMELMLYAFGMQNTVDPVRCLMVFAIGSFGVLVPTPGSAGTYHLCASKAMTMVTGVDATQSMAFVTAFHAVSFVFIVCVAALVCFLVQQSAGKTNAQR